jgi:hypothetical protein
LKGIGGDGMEGKRRFEVKEWRPWQGVARFRIEALERCDCEENGGLE